MIDKEYIEALSKLSELVVLHQVIYSQKETGLASWAIVCEKSYKEMLEAFNEVQRLAPRD